MDIMVSHEQGRVPVTVFHVKGDIDGGSYLQLQTKAHEAFDNGAHNLVIDLTGVRFMSSAGIRMINDIFKLLRTDAPGESDEAMRQGLKDGTFKSPHLKLVNPTRNVLDVLKMAGIDMFVEVHRDLKEAMASF